MGALSNGHWQLYEDNCVTMQSICWLFCWATTGNTSDDTAVECKAAFNKIFNHTYRWLDRELPLDLARKWRNTKPRRLYF